MKTTYKAMVIVELADVEDSKEDYLHSRLSYTIQEKLIKQGKYKLEFIAPLYGAPALIIKLHE